jgi:GNAT superfamily N-acetyltransferase
MINVRKIKPKDYKQTGEMVKATIAVSFKDLYPEILIKEFCKKYDYDNFKVKADDIDMFIAAENDNIVGVIGIKENQLRTFYVHPEQQGKGIGSKLYKKFEETTIERGIKKIVLEGSPLGQPIYEHFGFIKIKSIEKERVGQKYVDAVMEKHL